VTFSLFRHYAKYHGLRKDDLEYYFCNLLENEDTPESVQLQRGDTIMVRKRRKAEPPEAAADDDELFKDMRELMDDEEHMDATFVSGAEENGWKVSAHKTILTARGEYFKALFKTDTFQESKSCVIRVDPMFSEHQVKLVLEFMYTNRIAEIRDVSTDDLLCLLHLSDLWILRDLKRLVEHELIRDHMSTQSVARMYGATEAFHAQRLSRACIDFIMSNLHELAGNAEFEEEMKNYPHLCIPVLKAAADLIPVGHVHKKQRTDDRSGGILAGASALGSSPVPDSDA
jgi:speckle-type POZ protein